MPYGRVDDGFHSHPKRHLVSLAADGLLVRSISYAAQHLTDGRLPERWLLGVLESSTLVPGLSPRVEKRSRALLLDEVTARHESYMPLIERVEGGLLIHDYLDHNPSREEVEDNKRLARDRQGRHRRRRAQETLPWEGADAPVSRVTNADHPTPSIHTTPEKPPAPASGGSAEILWQRVKDQLRARLSEIDFAFQVEPVEATAYEDGRLELQAPAHNVGYLRSRYLPLFGSVASELEEGEVEVVLPESGAERQAREHQQARQQRADRRARRELGRDEDAVREDAV